MDAAVILHVRNRHSGFVFPVSFYGIAEEATQRAADYIQPKHPNDYAIEVHSWPLASNGHGGSSATLQHILEDAIYLMGVDIHATCEHGLSAWLCEGPQHYPADDRY